MNPTMKKRSSPSSSSTSSLLELLDNSTDSEECCNGAPQQRRTVLSTVTTLLVDTVLRNNTNKRLDKKKKYSSELPLLSSQDDAVYFDESCNSSNHSECSFNKPNTTTAVTDNVSLSKNSTNNTTTATAASSPVNKARQLLVGAAGIYGAYLYYGNVQEDLFRYRSVGGTGFTYVWFLQVLESAVTIAIGYVGRKVCGGRDNLPVTPFFKSGVSQLAAKALMSMSLAAGLSFPVVVLAKSAKIVPVMLGQLIMGGSSYTFRDYVFVFLIVCGTALLSAGNEQVPEGSDTVTGLVLIFLSLTADGFTGGLQKKLKRVTASMAPTTYDFLYYSHVAQFAAAVVICVVTGELWAAPAYLLANPAVWWCVLASCFCSAVGQCFIFYVISCFDPLVCTTITTTRKMLTVVLSLSFKGHDLTGSGCLGLVLAISALLVEVEGKVAQYRKSKQGSVETKATAATTTTTPPSSGNPTTTPSFCT
jgi:solute carrier family 35 (UDP-galactose transporter), member B1